MRALIIAAGKGTRINTGSVILPKPLYMVGRRLLIEHTILNLKQAGITEFVIVVGFMSEHIKYYLRAGEELGVSIKYIYNPHFDKELGYSVYCAKDEFKNENFILSMADHIVDPSIIRGLEICLSADNCCTLAVDTNLEDINDIQHATKVLSTKGFIKDIGWSIPKFNSVDCGVFGMTPDIFTGLSNAFKQNKFTLSDGVKEVTKFSYFKVTSIGSFKWAEVDTRSDIFLAEELIEQRGWRNNDK